MSKLDEKLDSIASQVAKLKLNQAQIEKEARIDELKNLLKKEELVKYVFGSTYDDEYAVLSSVIADRIAELKGDGE